MSVNSLPKTVTRQRRDCDLNPGPSAPESSTLTTCLLTYLNSDSERYTAMYLNRPTGFERVDAEGRVWLVVGQFFASYLLTQHVLLYRRQQLLTRAASRLSRL